MPVAAFNETKSFLVLCDLGICFLSLGGSQIHSVFLIFRVTPEHFVILKLTYWEKQNKLFHSIFSFSQRVWEWSDLIHVRILYCCSSWLSTPMERLAVNNYNWTSHSLTLGGTKPLQWELNIQGVCLWLIGVQVYTVHVFQETPYWEINMEIGLWSLKHLCCVLETNVNLSGEILQKPKCLDFP